MSKELTPRQKTIQVQRSIKSFVKNELEPMMLLEVEKKIESLNKSDVMLSEKNNEVYKLILKNYVKNSS